MRTHEAAVDVQEQAAGRQEELGHPELADVARGRADAARHRIAEAQVEALERRQLDQDPEDP